MFLNNVNLSQLSPAMQEALIKIAKAQVEILEQGQRDFAELDRIGKALVALERRRRVN